MKQTLWCHAFGSQGSKWITCTELEQPFEPTCVALLLEEERLSRTT